MTLSDWGAIGSIIGGASGIATIIITLALNKGVNIIKQNNELSNKKDNLRLLHVGRYVNADAKLKFEEIKMQLPNVYPYIWGPNEVSGELHNEVLEIFDVDYDNNKGIMGVEWKNCTKGIKYIYKDGMKWFNRGWRI